MPVYAWKGMARNGDIRRGNFFSRSHADLENVLLQNNIALIEAHVSLFAKKIAKRDKIAVLSHLLELVKAHIPIHKALTIIAATVTLKPQLKMIIEDCAALVAEGMPLSLALRTHDIIDDLGFAVITASEQIGNVTGALEALVDHNVAMTDFKRTLNSSLQGPCVTLIFFLVVIIGIGVGVIPRFEYYFASFNVELPFLTKVILKASSFIRSGYFLFTILCVFLLGFLIKNFSRLLPVRCVALKCIRTIPVIRSLYWSVYKMHFFTVLGMLHNQGISIGRALQIMGDSFESHAIKTEIQVLSDSIAAGHPLSHAIKNSRLACPETVAKLTIGESSGSLGLMIVHTADVQRQKIYATIHWWVTMAQPLILLLLGVMIALLVFALFMPLITLTSII